MSIAVVIDMNLSPEWGPMLERAGSSAIHWSKVGDPRAPDREIMDWAAANGRVVLTHDLDFGTILALTHKTGPAFCKSEEQDVMPDRIGAFVVAAIRQHENDLESGGLVVVEEGKNRVRILPI